MNIRAAIKSRGKLTSRCPFGVSLGKAPLELLLLDIQDICRLFASAGYFPGIAAAKKLRRLGQDIQGCNGGQ
jgi:hypothetical protein